MQPNQHQESVGIHSQRRFKSKEIAKELIAMVHGLIEEEEEKLRWEKVPSVTTGGKPYFWYTTNSSLGRIWVVWNRFDYKWVVKDDKRKLYGEFDSDKEGKQFVEKNFPSLKMANTDSSWGPKIADAYTRGMAQGKKDLIESVDQGLELAKKENFESAFYEGYCHGQGKKFKMSLFFSQKKLAEDEKFVAEVDVEFYAEDPDISISDTKVDIPYEIDIEYRSWGIKGIDIFLVGKIKIFYVFDDYSKENMGEQEGEVEVDLSRIKTERDGEHDTIVPSKLEIWFDKDMSADYNKSSLTFMWI